MTWSLVYAMQQLVRFSVMRREYSVVKYWLRGWYRSGRHCVLGMISPRRGCWYEWRSVFVVVNCKRHGVRQNKNVVIVRSKTSNVTLKIHYVKCLLQKG